jgi:hypothetical protein
MKSVIELLTMTAIAFLKIITLTVLIIISLYVILYRLLSIKTTKIN